MISNSEKISINIAGGSTFGVYPKISAEKTYNMYISDGWMVTYAGWQRATDEIGAGEGRGLFHSLRGNFLIAVIGNKVYKFLPSGAYISVGPMRTSSGEVSIDENLSAQICIVDGTSAYIYNYTSGGFAEQALSHPNVGTVRPNYVCYMNTFFLLASSPLGLKPQNFYAATYASDTTITIALQDEFSIQTKPDSAIAIKRLPGQSSNIIVFGYSTAEIWSNTGGVKNFSKNTSISFDNGCVSVNTIAANDERVVWLAQNENSAPFIMSIGGNQQGRISTDGIDNLLQTIVRPDQSTAFFFRQDGHLFYQLTFFNPEDNLTLVYDFNNNMFFHASDHELNYHPARQVAYFNEETYFVSIKNAALFKMGNEFVTYNNSISPTVVGNEIPRIRITKTYRKDDTSRFRVGYFTFPIEQGVATYDFDEELDCGCFIITEDGLFTVTESDEFIVLENCDCLLGNFQPRVDMSFSKNGNQSFSNVVSRELNSEGNYRNRLNWYRMGYTNEFTIQLRFWGFQRFVVHDGIMEVFL